MQDFPWEDGLLERKTENDLRDLLKTLVAFANSVRPGHVATLLIGEKDDGSIQGIKDPEAIQKRVRKEAECIYPDIVWRSRIYEADGKSCLRVEVEYSGNTPHFGGAAWVRKGSSSVKASEEVFQTLIDIRNDKTREISKWVGKVVTVNGELSTVPPPQKEFGSYGGDLIFVHRWGWREEATILSVNRYWVTFVVKTREISEPIEKLTLNFDNEKDRLMVMVKY